MIKTGIIFFTFLLSFLQLVAQQSSIYTSEDRSYRDAIELLNEQKIAAAGEAFGQYLEAGKDPVKIADARYYQAYCAMQMKNLDGEALIEEFLSDYPNHAKAGSAYFELGNMKYRERNYKLAIRYYEKIYIPNLPLKQADEARFKLGYSYFTQKQFDKAYEQFEINKRTENAYQFPASYYSGYINFQKGEYDRAFYDFSRAEKNETYARIVPALLVRIYYKQHRYDELIEYAEKALVNNKISQKSDLYLFLAEARYHLKDYEGASEDYNRYLELKKTTPGRDILFRIADTEQKTGKYKPAIDHFKTVALTEDTLGWFASYYLGNLYVKTGNKNFALTAYKKARDGGPYNSEVEEESAFKYAKVSFDLGHYEQAIQAILKYKKDYPDSRRGENSDEILTEAYLLTSNYDEALEYFDLLDKRTPTINKAYQKIAFYKGTILFNDQKIEPAVSMFDKSLMFPLFPEYVIKANFWKGEAYSAGEKHEEAISSYAAVFRADSEGKTGEYLKARYGIGYAWFNLKEYEKALDHFQYYTAIVRNRSNKQNFTDALTRLGDCYYATKNYQEALKVFDEVISVGSRGADYAWYRKGVIYGILDNLTQSNVCFDKVLSDRESNYYTDALFQKGRFNFEKGEYPEAITLFTRVIENFEQSRFVPFALQDRAIAYSNLKQYEATVSDYATIIEQYANHSVAKGSLLGLQEALTILGQADSFTSYLETYKNANPGSSELESIEFDAAKNLYFSQKYPEAVKACDRFEKDFPQSAFLTEVIYYRSDAFYRDGRLDQAIEGFYSIAVDKTFNKHNRVLQRLAMLEFQQTHYKRAISNARKLELIAANEKETYNAWQTLMNSYYKMGKYDSSDVYAEMILEKGPESTNAQSEALVLLGKTAMERLQYDTAQDYFIQIVNMAQDARGAEAQYYLAYIEFKKEDYRNSLESLFDMNSKYASYEAWLGRSFLLIADNYIALEEYFQAKATLESLIEHSPEEEVVKEARERLNEINDMSAIKEKEESVPDTLEIDDPAKDNRP